MRKSSAALAACSVALGCAAFGLLSACGNSQGEADRAAQAQIEQEDQLHAQSNDLKSLDALQPSYDTLATDKDLSPQMQIIVRGRQAQLRYERVELMLADLRGKELAIGRSIDGIGQLALQVAGAQSSIEALKTYDPTSQIAKLVAQKAAIQGSSDHLTWDTAASTTENSGGQVSSPTLFKVSGDIDSLTADIAKNKADTDAQQKLRVAKIAESEKCSRQAEGESGDQQVQDTIAASQARRDASIADSRSDQLQSALARLESNLQKAQDQKTALDASVAALDGQISALQTAWTSIQQQMLAQQKLEQKMIGSDSDTAASGEEPSAFVTISQHAQALAGQLQDAAGLREKVVADLNAVASQFNTAATEAGQLRTDLKAREQANDPDAVIWKQTEETLHPAYFTLQRAAALEDSAAVAAGKTRIDALIARLFDGYEIDPASAAGEFKVLNVAVSQQPMKIPGITALLDQSKTGIEMPKAFSDLNRMDTDQLEQSQDAVNKLYAKALEAYRTRMGATDIGAAAQERKNLALMGEASTDRGWAQFATAMGDASDAQNYLRDAADAESQIESTVAVGEGRAGMTGRGMVAP